MTASDTDTLQAALAALDSGGGGSRVLVAWLRVQLGSHGLTPEGLDDVETERVSRLRRPHDQARYLAAHHLARRVTGEWLGCAPEEVRFDRTCGRCGLQHGAPRVVGPSRAGREVPSVSLTHSGELVAVALGVGGAVGLDVEEPWPDDGEARLASMVRADDEPAADLRELWVSKEAVLKAAGVGLTVAMTDLALRHGTATLLGRSWWYAPLHSETGYAGAVAGAGHTVPDIQVVRLHSPL
ncbi:MAG: hypothetical protein Q4G51_00015 [Dermatophilus congolensis]|nr:hypothetical protein [Dermatophilus congolensis]